MELIKLKIDKIVKSLPYFWHYNLLYLKPYEIVNQPLKLVCKYYKLSNKGFLGDVKVSYEGRT